MKIVTVIPLKRDTNKEDLTYFSAQEVRRGNIVTVPLRNKKILALVVAVEDARGAKSDIKEMDFNLRKVLEVKEHSIWREEYLESIFEISRYFSVTKNKAASFFLPKIFQDEYDKVSELALGQKDNPNIGKYTKEIGTEKLILQAPPEDRISSYKTLIRESFAMKKSVFIALPTERDIKNIYEILSKGIEQFTFYVHSGLPKKKIVEKFEKIMKTEHGVLILGTVPFLSIPRRDIGLIIVEHENSGGYKTIQAPHFDLRTFAELFAAKINAKFVLADTLLRYETIGRREIDGLVPVHPLSFRLSYGGEIETKNPKGTPKEEFRIFPEKVIEEIKKATLHKKNVFVFSLRKGLATMTICRDCGETMSCEKCGAPLVLYHSEGGKKRIFACNRCQTLRSDDTLCKNCGSWNLVPLGIGTDTVYEELKKSLSNGPSSKNESKTKIFKLDKESALNAKGAEKIIKEFEKSPGSILIGTEMALFYLNNEIPLSLIASFDSLWSIPNFKMSEKIIQLIISILRVTRDKLIIQTKNEKDGAILAVLGGNLLSFVRGELALRKDLHYPPFRRFIKITHIGDKAETTEARRFLKENFKEYEPEIFSGFIMKLKDKYNTNALIKIDTKKWSLPEISMGSKIDENLLAKLSSLPRNFQVFVDPEDLL